MCKVSLIMLACESGTINQSTLLLLLLLHVGHIVYLVFKGMNGKYLYCFKIKVIARYLKKAMIDEILKMDTSNRYLLLNFP